jgi:hypothetical protein
MARITKDVSVGDDFKLRPKVISWERLWTFSGAPFARVMNPESKEIVGGWPVSNIHTDLAFAKSCGLPKIAASATQYQGYVVELMLDLFGFEWLSYGRMDTKFINLVDAGDTLVTSATVQSKEEKGSTTEFVFNVDCENQSGEKVLVGWASGSVGEVPAAGPEGYQKRVAELRADDRIQKVETPRREMAPLVYKVTPELNQQFCYGEEDFQPWYIHDTEFGPPIAHPGLILNFSNSTRSPSFQRGGPGREGGVNTQDEAFWYNPARVGKTLTVTWPSDFAGTYESRGRSYSISEIRVVDEDGLEIVRRLDRGTLAATPEDPYQKRKE